ncbi:TPA: DUF3265 domain-containing protein, partial [Vibrio vulnificus]|nr:DUF3265 domain-containing protein [Vibrio vulnificus]
FAVIFGGESGLQKLGLCGIHPLTRRYILVTLCTYMCTHNEHMHI